MKAFVEFYQYGTGWNGKDWSGPPRLIRLCGSDSYRPLDARLKVENLHFEARKHIKALKRVQPCIRAYKLMLGNLRNNRPISQLVEVFE
jgi:hypothetical protein